MKKANYFFALTIITLFFSACSKDDDAIKDNPVVFKSLTASKEVSFIDESITLNIDGEEFTDVVITSSNPSITVSQVSSTTYTVSASKATKATISVQLKNNSYTEKESIALNFYEHGVIQYKFVEGIEIGVDKTDKIIALFGEPEAKEVPSTGNYDYWYYYSKGFSIVIHKTAKIAVDIRIYNEGWSRIMDDKIVNFSVYPYSIVGAWNFSTAPVNMDAIVNLLGQPLSKHESTTDNLKWYVYKDVVFFFFSDSIDDYIGKKVTFMDIY